MWYEVYIYPICHSSINTKTVKKRYNPGITSMRISKSNEFLIK